LKRNTVMTRFIKENKLVSLMIFALIILTLGVIVALLAASNMNMPPKGKIAPEVKKSLVQQVTGELDIRSAFVKVADEVGPAVVSKGARLETISSMSFSEISFVICPSGNINRWD